MTQTLRENEFRVCERTRPGEGPELISAIRSQVISSGPLDVRINSARLRGSYSNRAGRNFQLVDITCTSFANVPRVSRREIDRPSCSSLTNIEKAVWIFAEVVWQLAQVSTGRLIKRRNSSNTVRKVEDGERWKRSRIVARCCCNLHEFLINRGLSSWK